jgi:Ribbon-helix-helix protein, copG family
MTRPLQVYLEAADLERLDAWAQERGWTKSQAVRAAVRALTRPAADDPVLALSGMVLEGLPADASEQFDRHLQQTFVGENAPRYQKRARARKSTVRR